MHSFRYLLTPDKEKEIIGLLLKFREVYTTFLLKSGKLQVVWCYLKVSAKTREAFKVARQASLIIVVDLDWVFTIPPCKPLSKIDR